MSWLEDLPLDWTKDETRTVHRLLVEAYPLNATALVLAKNSGLRVQSLNQMTTVELLFREILEKARLADRLLQLLAEVLTDPSVEAIHPQLAALVAGHEAKIQRAAIERKPSLATLALLPPVLEVWAPDDGEARAMADRAVFEKTINAAAGFLDISIFRTRLAEAEARTARIEIEGKAKGTGFLVGDELLLTNWHVVKDAGGDAGGDGVARLDHLVTGNKGTTESGRAVAFADDWLVASSPHDTVPHELGTDGPAQGYWDFALVRLAEPVAAQAIGPDPAAGGVEPRGHYVLDGGAYRYESDEPVLIVGHPDGRPMQLSYASPSQVRVTTHQNRIRYQTNTEGGSSGSPVFNREWRVIGLHHASGPTKVPGELDQQAPGFNQGIPVAGLVGELRRQLAGRPELTELGLH
jgi:Trypsin-like peptidase domain